MLSTGVRGRGAGREVTHALPMVTQGRGLDPGIWAPVGGPRHPGAHSAGADTHGHHVSLCVCTALT